MRMILRIGFGSPFPHRRLCPPRQVQTLSLRLMRPAFCEADRLIVLECKRSHQFRLEGLIADLRSIRHPTPPERGVGIFHQGYNDAERNGKN